MAASVFCSGVRSPPGPPAHRPPRGERGSARILGAELTRITECFGIPFLAGVEHDVAASWHRRAASGPRSRRVRSRQPFLLGTAKAGDAGITLIGKGNEPPRIRKDLRQTSVKESWVKLEHLAVMVHRVGAVFESSEVAAFDRLFKRSFQSLDDGEPIKCLDVFGVLF